MLFVILALMTMSTRGKLAVADSSETGWGDPHKPQGVPGLELALTADGRTDYVILLPGEPTTQEKKAAQLS